MAKTAAKRTSKNDTRAPTAKAKVSKTSAERVGTQTISGSVPTPIVKRVREVARLEDRTTSQVVSSALDLYTRLPAEAHLALRRLSVMGDDTALDQMYVEVGREILNRAFDAAMYEVARNMRHPELDTLETEDDIADFAVRVIKGSRERDRAERLARRGG